jgi:hypothetical protein
LHLELAGSVTSEAMRTQRRAATAAALAFSLLAGGIAVPARVRAEAPSAAPSA